MIAPRPLLPVFVAALALVFTAALSPARPAAAHPLGNFSVNRLALIDLSQDGTLNLRYVLDMAEIPTFQEMRSLDRNGDGAADEAESSAYLSKRVPDLTSKISLSAGDRAVALNVTNSTLALLPGQGGLQTMRIVIDMTGALPDGWKDGASLAYHDANYSDRLGWRNVVVRPGEGVNLYQTSAALMDETQELTVYPTNRLSSPPAVTDASLSFKAGTTTTVATEPASTSRTVGRSVAQKTLGHYASLVEEQHLTPAFVILALLLAALWGAMHALSPGHGKTIVAAYLVGERGTGRHALFLGLVVTATHTMSVFTLGLVALLASDVLAAEDVFYWLSLLSGVLVIVLGMSLLYGRVRSLLRGTSAALGHDHHNHDHHAHEHHHDHDEAEHHHHDHESVHDHDHAHDDHDHPHHAHEAHGHDHGPHGHSHMPTAPGWRGLLALGIAGGIVPCPTALVVMLGAIAIDRVVYGFVLVTAFSVGLAGVLTGIGFLMVYGRRFVTEQSSRLTFVRSGWAQRALLVTPILSALGILGLGLMLTSRVLI